MRIVAIIGNLDFDLVHSLALLEAAKGAGVKLVHCEELKYFEVENKPNQFKPEMKLEFTVAHHSPSNDELNIEILDKYGKPLTNPGSKFHK